MLISDKITYERSIVENSKDHLYIFTDNCDRSSGNTEITSGWYKEKYGKDKKLYYPKTTTALIRGLDNALPITIQHWYHTGAKGEAGRWNDEDFDEFKKVIDDDILQIYKYIDEHNPNLLVVPNGGFVGRKISMIHPDRTPKLYSYLNDKLNELYRNVVTLD